MFCVVSFRTRKSADTTGCSPVTVSSHTGELPIRCRSASHHSHHSQPHSHHSQPHITHIMHNLTHISAFIEQSPTSFFPLISMCHDIQNRTAIQDIEYIKVPHTTYDILSIISLIEDSAMLIYRSFRCDGFSEDFLCFQRGEVSLI